MAQLRAHRGVRTGARLLIEGSPDVLDRGTLLLLSKTGLAFQRCEFVRLDGCEAAVSRRAHKLLARGAKHGARRARRDRSTMDDAIA